MPTIFRRDGFAVLIYTNDHRPAHVHIFKAEGEVVVQMGNAHTPPRVRENIGMSRRHERAALMMVAEHQVVFLAEWRRIHGQGIDRRMGN
jgi:hypothetical protein